MHHPNKQVCMLDILLFRVVYLLGMSHQLTLSAKGECMSTSSRTVHKAKA